MVTHLQLARRLSPPLTLHILGVAIFEFKGVDGVMRKRAKNVHIRMTEEEYKVFEKLLEKSGLTQNEYGLRCLSNKKIVVLDGFKELAEQVKKVGVNVNQIAKGINSRSGVSEGVITEMQKELGEVWRSLSAFLQKVM